MRKADKYKRMADRLAVTCPGCVSDIVSALCRVARAEYKRGLEAGLLQRIKKAQEKLRGDAPIHKTVQ